jgi:hypothetical protein
MKRFGKPTVIRPRYVDGPSAHFSFRDMPVSPTTSTETRAGHGVEAGRVHDGVELERLVWRCRCRWP